MVARCRRRRDACRTHGRIGRLLITLLLTELFEAAARGGWTLTRAPL
jgi:hypothetical protein